jgi:serine/threonine-protein kinase
MAELKSGVELSGHILSDELGVGGQARVFRAEPVNGGPAVALKVAVKPELVTALRTEGAVLRRLSGPRFVKILEEHLDADPPHFVLELCPGGDLRVLLGKTEGNKLPPADVVRLARGILEGAAFMHEEGVVHGDFKPENVLLDSANEPRIADLGLSRAHRKKLLDAGSVADSLASGDEKVRGTFDYIAPEVRHGGDLTPAADVYSLGVLVYELLVGRRPLGLFKLPGEVLAPVAVPPALDRLVARALAHDPEQRYRDGRQMLQDLDAGDQGIPLVESEKPAAPGVNPLLVRIADELLVHHVFLAALLIVPVVALVGCYVSVTKGPRAGIEAGGIVAAILSIPALFAIRFAHKMRRERLRDQIRAATGGAR